MQEVALLSASLMVEVTVVGGLSRHKLLSDCFSCFSKRWNSGSLVSAWAQRLLGLNELVLFHNQEAAKQLKQSTKAIVPIYPNYNHSKINSTTECNSHTNDY